MAQVFSSLLTASKGNGRRAFEIAGKAKDGGALLNRLRKDTYAKQGKDAREVRRVIDLISALSGGSSSVSLGIADNVGGCLMRSSKLAGKGDASQRSELNLPSYLNAARKTGATFSADTKANPSNGPKASGVVRPLGLKPGEDGKVTVTMLEPIFSWKNGYKKDIGSKRVTKKFNDKYHFINWWKKVTDFGADFL